MIDKSVANTLPYNPTQTTLFEDQDSSMKPLNAKKLFFDNNGKPISE